MKIKLSKSQWEEMGKKAGWTKTAIHRLPELNGTVSFYTLDAGQARAMGAKPQVEMEIKAPGIDMVVDLSRTQDPDLAHIYSIIMMFFTAVRNRRFVCNFFVFNARAAAKIFLY